jgi:hypothetical protein
MFELDLGVPATEILSMAANILAKFLPGVLGGIATKGSWTNTLALATGTASLSAAILVLIEKEKVGGANTPVMADLAEDGTLVKSLINQPAPTYSDGSQIPYLNHRGSAAQFMPLCLFPAEAMTAVGVYHLSVGGFNFWNPAGWLNIARAALCFTSAGGWVGASVWCAASDLIVPYKSQDMSSIFPDSKRRIERSIGFTHFDANTLNEKVPQWLSGNSTLDITNVITETQPGEESFEEIPRIKTTSVTVRYQQYGEGCEESSERDETPAGDVNYSIHPIVRFTGLNPNLPAEEQWKLWPKNQNGVITVPTTLGKPVTLVGHLESYYMNSADVSVTFKKLVKNLQFNVDFGKWAGRFVDFDGDGDIDNNDKPNGSFFFCGLDKNLITMGENKVEVIMKPKYGSTISSIATIKYGSTLDYFEASDIDGNSAVPPLVLNKAIRWNTNETKIINIGLRNSLNTSASQNNFALESSTGELNFTNVAGTPSAGQYTILSGSAVPYVVQASISSSQLKCDNATITPDQTIHMTLVDNLGNVIGAYSSFYIDNNSPTLKIVSPKLLTDYDEDGTLTPDDQCVTSVSIPAPDGINCSELTDTISDPAERAMAQSLCQQSQQPVTEIQHAECDGIDNDMDGVYDQNDKSEFDAMQFYSPKYNTSGVLIDGWVRVDFEADDNLYQYFQNLSAAKWEVFRVNGSDFNPATDQLVYTKNLSGPELKLQKSFADRWDYSPYTNTNPAPDGLYAIRVYCRDQAGNETYGPPAYFIVDKSPPSLSILGNWRDERGNTEFGSLSSIFTAYARPGLPLDRNDSPANEIQVILHPQGLWSFLADPITATFPVSYVDNIASKPDGSIDPDRTNDGLADPIMLTIPEVDFTSKFSRLWSIPIPDGIYSVEYIARDKAGNEYKLYDNSKIIRINRGKGTLPITDEASGGTGSIESDQTYTKKITFNQNYDDPEQQRNSGIFSGTSVLGNTEFVVQILRQDAGGTGYTSQAGIRVRSEGEAHIDIALNQNNTITVYGTNGEITVPGTFVPPNAWLKVVRDGDYINTYVSNDGKTWTLVDSQVFAPGEKIEIGTFYTNNSPDPKTVDMRIGFGSDPFGLFAQNAVVALDQLIMADRSSISGGNAAANGYIELGCASNLNGSLTGGADALLRENAFINGSLTVAGALNRQNQTTISGTIAQHASVPQLTIATESTPAGSTPTTINCDQIATLPPGTYGDVHIYSRARVTLQTGTYYFKSFVIEPDVNITVNVANGPVQLKIADNCSIGDLDIFVLSGGTSPKLLSIYSNQSSELRIGCNVLFTGCITAPNACVHVNSVKQLDGTARIRASIKAKSIQLEPDVFIDATGACGTNAPAGNTYEAESATLSGGANTNTNHTGYSGTGFVDGFYNSTSAQASFTVNAASAGNYELKLRYSAGNGTSANTGLYVNGAKIKNITCAATADWNTWADETETVTLSAGNNTIAYKAEVASPYCINLDYININGGPVDPCVGVSGGGNGLRGTAFGLNPPWAAGSEYCKATDGDINTFYDNSQADGGYTGLDLGSSKVIRKIRYYPRAGWAGRMVGGKFQGSNTSGGSGFVDLYTITSTPVMQWNDVTISNSTGYRWVRYLSPTGGYGNIAEMEFYESPSLGGAFEAENLSYSSSAIGTNIGENQYVQFNSGAATGDWMQFNLPSIVQGTYAVTVYYKSNNNRGIFQAMIDGNNQGGTCDEYEASPVNAKPFAAGLVTFGSTATHTVKFTVTGKNASSSAYAMTIDKITFTPTTFPDPNKWYKIATKANNSQCLDVSGGNYVYNDTIQLWNKCNVNQEFKFKYAGSGYYTITCRSDTGYSIDMSGNFVNGQKLKLWYTQSYNANQKFKLVALSGGYYRLESSNPAFSIDNWGAGGSGTKPALWTSDDNNDNQKWVITELP